MSASRTGAQRCRRAVRISLRSVSAEWSGEEVGGSGRERDWTTGWWGGKSGESILRRSA